ncbi:hypothetical protein [Flavihumibacter petaseus]|nr:hypothetical protein [Flavihumibacter petaseus]
MGKQAILKFSIFLGGMEHYYDALFGYIGQIIKLPEQDKAQCRISFKPLKMSKDSLLEVAGKVHTHHNFIVSGFMRKYYINDKGDEVTVDLNDGPRFLLLTTILPTRQFLTSTCNA